MSALAIETIDLARTYRAKKGRASTPVIALDGVDLQVQPGELFGLLGPNGAGKTTLIKILATLLLPSRGEARVDGLDVARDMRAIRERISMVSGGESSGYGILTVREQLWMFSQLYGVPTPVANERMEGLLRVVGLWEERDRKVSNLSTGMRQKLNLCRGLMSDPRILFLDEPTVGLDVGAARDLRTYIRDWLTEKPGRTILLTTHYMQEADELCDRVAIIHKGRIIACDRPEALKARGQEKAHFRLMIASQNGLRAEIEGLPGVEHVSQRALGFETEVQLQLASDGAIAEVVQALASSDERILNLQKVEPTLEDVFVELVGKSLREAEAED